MRLKVAGVLTTGIIVMAVGFGLNTNADGSMWRNDRNTIKLFPSSLSTLLASTTASSFKIGASGSRVSNLLDTTCNIQVNTSISATSTGKGFCTGVTGVVYGDRIWANLSTSTAQGFGAIVLVDASASTTAGAIDFTFLNLTGAAKVPASISNFGSSTPIRATR